MRIQPLSRLLLLAAIALTGCNPHPEAIFKPVQEEEPYKISGDFTYSNDFVLETYYVEQAAALADMHGFVIRDQEWITPVESQVLGFMDVDYDNNKGTYSISLPVAPEGLFNDVDQDDQSDRGVQIFAASYWPNLTGGPYSEGDDPSFGWPSYLASIKTDSENQDEVIGGKLVIWSPDDQQQFPSDFGIDGLLFTKDDPVSAIPAGYSVVDLDVKPFGIIRDSIPELTLYEPTDLEVKDFSADTFVDAFNKMFTIVEKEYAFTDVPGKSPDWKALRAEIEPMVKNAQDKNDNAAFYEAMRQFTLAFKDGHVGISGDNTADMAYSKAISSGYGLAIRVLDNLQVVVSYVTPGGPAQNAGIQRGAIITALNDTPILSAIRSVEAYSGPFSASFTREYQQARYLTRAPLGETSKWKFTNPGGQEQEVTLIAVNETESFDYSSTYKNMDPNALPVDFSVFSDSSIGYVQVNSNYDDLNLAIRLFERALITFENNNVDTIIIDMRLNFGGSPLGLAGYLTNEVIELGQLEYFSEKTEKFEPSGVRDKILPMTRQFDFSNKILLVGDGCASACEIEAYGFSQVPGMEVFGETPTAGVEAEVARGQFILPGGISLQIPTGRFTLPDGSIFLEGEGVQPTQKVPVTIQSVLTEDDPVISAVINYLFMPAGAGVTPSADPVIEPKEEGVKILETGNPQTLEGLANEKYPNTTESGKTYTYTVELTENSPLFWYTYWCAKDKTLLANIYKNIQFQFAINSKILADPDKLITYDVPGTESQCKFVGYYISDWTEGEHHLQTRTIILREISDGVAKYQPRSFDYDYTVYVDTPNGN